MSVAGVNAATENYAAYNTTKTDSKAQGKDTADKKNDAAATEGAVYEKTSTETDKKAPYTVNKMSAEDRAALVKQLKADQENRQKSLLDIVNKMIHGQATTFAQADDDFWKFLAKGDYTVDAATKAQAQKDIAEDGYYGVKQTSERIFDFASALAGDDVEQMKKMQAAFEKGFKQAENLWGGKGKLPSISYETHDAVTKKFEEYYKSKGEAVQKQDTES